MVIAPATTKREEPLPSNVTRMRALLDEPLFRGYMKRIPARHQANAIGQPWQVWIETADHKWLTQKYATYPEAWRVFVDQYRKGNDPTITSRRLFYAPPGEWYKVKVRLQRPTPSGTTHRIETRWRQTFFWPEHDLNWCGRCRRPVYWMPLFPSHHALRRLPAVCTDDNYRCVICGIRWIATPGIDQMTKVEPKP